MKVDVEELGACKRRLQVEETPEVVQEAWARAFTRVQREAKLPGFRKGKVPRSMIKLHFSDDVRQEVARHLIPEVYRQALAETQLKPVEEPDLQEVTLEESSPLKFSAVVEIKPAIALGAVHRPRGPARAQAVRREPRWTRPSRTCRSSTRSTERWSGPPTWATS